MFDLMFFVLIFGVFLLSYGVAAQSLLYPNSEPTWQVLTKIVYQPYFTLFGQFNLEELLGYCDDDDDGDGDDDDGGGGVDGDNLYCCSNSY